MPGAFDGNSASVTVTQGLTGWRLAGITAYLLQFVRLLPVKKGSPGVDAL